VLERSERLVISSSGWVALGARLERDMVVLSRGGRLVVFPVMCNEERSKGGGKWGCFKG
jgi:hypothetical protein